MKILKNPRFLLITLGFLLLGVTVFVFLFKPFSIAKDQSIPADNNTTPKKNFLIPLPTEKKSTLQTPPVQKVLPTDYHIYQSFNNCGPAALSMALKFYGINASQAELGQSIRPYQVPLGINDDKSATLNELAEESKKYGLIPYHRPSGDVEKIKMFITYDIPVIARTWLKKDEDIGHYRVVKGYNDSTKQIVQDDSLQDKNLWYTYDEFNEIWIKFNYEYLVLVPKDKIDIVSAILAEDENLKASWQKAVVNSQKQLVQNPTDINIRFNLSVAYYNSREYQKSIEEYEKIESLLPFRTLWYQLEPIRAYYEVGNYNKVLEITDRVLQNQNLAFSELYILRGKVYQKTNRLDLARAEFEKAVLYNQNLKEAQDALASLN